MKILDFRSENVKRLSVVEIHPDGSLVIIAGENEQGKSSTLDSIDYALTGKRSIPPQPVRRGQEEARIALRLGDDRDVDLTVICVLRPNGYYRVEVTTKDGAKLKNVREMLDRLVGPISFDPSEFSQMGRTPQGRAQQLEILKNLVGLDFTALDEKRQNFYDERKLVNHQVGEIKGQIAGLTLHEDTPKDEMNIVALSTELETALASHKAIENAEHELVRARSIDEQANKDLEGILNRISELERQITILKKRANEARGIIKTTEGAIKEKAQRLIDLVDVAIDPNPIRQKIAEAEGINRKVRENKALKVLQERCEVIQKKAQSLTDQIVQIDAQKAQQIQKAEFPVSGLSFNDESILLNELPFEQASHMEKLWAGMAIRFAMNPKLRVALIREADHFDEKHLQMIAKWAEERHIQVWCERQIRPGEKPTVIIEDGRVKEKKTGKANIPTLWGEKGGKDARR